MSELFNMLAHALAPLGTPTGKPATRRRAPQARPFHHEFDDFGIPGWSITAYGTYTQDRGALPDVTIERAELNTGQRVIELELAELPINTLEAEVSEDIDAGNRMAAAHLARDDGDRGEYERNARIDRRGA